MFYENEIIAWSHQFTLSSELVVHHLTFSFIGKYRNHDHNYYKGFGIIVSIHNWQMEFISSSCFPSEAENMISIHWCPLFFFNLYKLLFFPGFLFRHFGEMHAIQSSFLASVYKTTFQPLQCTTMLAFFQITIMCSASKRSKTQGPYLMLLPWT